MTSRLFFPSPGDSIFFIDPRPSSDYLTIMSDPKSALDPDIIHSLITTAFTSKLIVTHSSSTTANGALPEQCGNEHMHPTPISSESDFSTHVDGTRLMCSR